MRAWIVTEDLCDSWGTDMRCYGIFTTEEKAKECAEKHKCANVYSYPVDVEFNKLIAFYVE